MRKATVTLATALLLTLVPGTTRAVAAPAPVAGAMYTVIAERQTSLTWIGTPEAAAYRVYVNGIVARTTSGPSTRVDITLGRLLGPLDVVEVQSLAGDGTAAARVRAEYWDYTWAPVPAYTLYFGSGSSALSSQAKTTLRAFAQYVASHGFAEVRLIGRTDGTPGTASAYLMAKMRAEHARIYFASRSDVATLVSSWGAAWPLANPLTPEGQALNRRVDLEVR